MPIDTVSKPQYPAVPQAPGVPPVLRQAGQAAALVQLLVADAVQVVRMFQGPQWGIFDENNNPLIIGDSVLAVDYRVEYRVADFPITQGGFASYNKVRMPFDIRLTFASDGRQSLMTAIQSGNPLDAGIGSGIVSLFTGTSPQIDNRRKFLAQIDQAISSLRLFQVMTPEATYPSVNITHYDYRRDAKGGGASMIIIDVWCQEVRIAAKPVYENGQMTGTAPATDPGTPGSTQTAQAQQTTPSSATTGGPTGQATQEPSGATTQSGGTVAPSQVGPSATSQTVQAPATVIDVGSTAAPPPPTANFPVYDATGAPVSGASVTMPPNVSTGSYLNTLAGKGLTPNYYPGTSNIISFTQQ